MLGALADSSLYGGLAVLAGTATVDTANKKFGAAALAMTAGYAVMADGPRFVFSGDFTIEGWFYLAGAPTAAAALLSFGSQGSNALEIYMNTTGKLQFYNGNTTVIVGGTTVTNNAWHHWALTRSGTTAELWLDGVSQGTTTNLAGSIGRGEIVLGAWRVNATYSDFLNGALDEVRITSGVARYTAPFTPPSAAFGESVGADPSWNSVSLLLHCNAQVNAFVSAALRGNPIPLVRVTPPAIAYKTAPGAIKIRDVYFDGNGRINGTTKVKGTPNYAVRRRVRLWREQDGLLARETWSDAVTGAYSFDHIDRSKKYTVITYDHEHNFRAVVADNLTPDLMP